MKNRRIKNPIYAALLLSAFSFSLDAHAELMPKQGVSAAELLSISENFKVQQDGLTVSFFGAMPKRCAEGASFKRDANTLMFSMPKCDIDFIPVSGEAMVDVAEVFHPIKLEDLSGTVKVRYLAPGSSNDKKRAVDEELKDASGQTIVLKSSKEIADEAAAVQAKKDAEDLKKASDSFFTKLDLLCKKGDYVGLGEEIEKASTFLGDVSDLLALVDQSQMQKYKKDLQASSDPESAKLVFESYLAAAGGKGWDAEYLNDIYVEKRFGFIDDMRSDTELSSKEIDKEIRDWKSDLRGISRAQYKEHKKDFAIAYGDLFAREVAKGNMDEAIKYANKAKELSPSVDAEKFDKKISEVYLEKFKECVEKGPMKAESCEKKFANKSQEYANNVKNSIANRARGGDEEAQDEYASFVSDYTQTYGGGMSYNYSGFGKVSQQPGSIQQYKQQQIMQYQQQQQMQYQQQMMQQYQQQMGGGYGMGGGLGGFGMR